MVRSGRLTRPDPSRAAAHSAALVGIYALLSVTGVVAGSLWAWVPIWIVEGFLLHGAYSAMHDAAHGTLFASRRANRVSCLAWAVPLGLNASLWRCWHLEHHRATRTGDDPEPRGDISLLAVYVGAFPVGGSSIVLSSWLDSLRALFGRPPRYADRASARRAVRANAAWLLIFTACAAVAGVTAFHWLLVIWLAPLGVYWLAVSVVFGLAEHEGTPDVGTQIDVTRSVTSNRVIRWLVWNSNFHAAHHVVPTVAYANLPAVDAALGDRVSHRSRSYTRFHAGFAVGTVARHGRARRRVG
jgi:fatty acid desaturase